MSSKLNVRGKSPKRKKPSVVVSSRYKQAAADVSRCSSKGSSSNSSGKNQSIGSNDVTMNRTDFSVTGQWNSNGMTKALMSTPGFKDVEPPLCDASVINADDSQFPELKLPLVSTNVKFKPNLKSAPSHSTTENSRMPCVAVYNQQGTKDIVGEIGEADIDLMYAKYLQALFVKSMLITSTESRMRNAAMDQHKLFIENEKLMKQTNDAKNSINVVKHAKQLLELCEKEKEKLMPILGAVPKTMNQYSDIVNAVENIRHQLVTSHLTFQPTSESDIIALLQKCSSLFQLVLDNVVGKDLTLIYQQLNKVTALLQATNSEISRSTKVAVDTDALVGMETSLKLCGTL